MAADWQDRGVRMPAGMGVIQWQGQIVVYQIEAGEIAWARLLGAEALPLSEALSAAIRADRSADRQD